MRRRFATLGLATAALLLLPGGAQAGEYVVSQCHSANPSHEASSGGSYRGDYIVRDRCGSGGEGALEIQPNTSSVDGRFGNWYWQAPPGTRIVGLSAEARLRRADGHKARLMTADATGRPLSLIASGGSDPTGFLPVGWTAPAGSAGVPRIYLTLVCDDGGSSCDAPSPARAMLRQVELRVRDTVAPEVTIEGDLIRSGWLRDEVNVLASAKDAGSGVRVGSVAVNGDHLFPQRLFKCVGIAATISRLQPCSFESAFDANSAQTALAPFHDGANQVVACARDVSTVGLPNQGCDRRLVFVDNAPPSINFRYPQAQGDPELLRAEVLDATSGVDKRSVRLEFRPKGSGAWRSVENPNIDHGLLTGRVDSEAAPPGIYEFRAVARDIAGNHTVVDNRPSGQPMELKFPLTQPTRVNAFFPGGQVKQVVPYRESSKVRGFLTEPDGTPIAGEQVIIREDFARGSLVQRRTEIARTDENGAYRSKIPAGPSREVTVSYGGSRQFQPDRKSDLDFTVKSRVGLKVHRNVKAGKAAVFKGKVGRYFARVPDGGKLVELQFKKRAKTWNTAKEAMGTSNKGRIRIPYRFKRFYEQRVTFVFRLKATKEGNWPYRLPASSRPVRVTVVPNRK